jgi:hypothetical protein
LYRDAYHRLLRLESQLLEKESYYFILPLLDLKIALAYRLFPLTTYRELLADARTLLQSSLKAIHLLAFYRYNLFMD